VSFGFCARGARSTFAALSLFVLFAVGGCGSSDKKPAATTQASSASTSATSNSTGSATSTTASPSAATLEITVARGQVVGGVKRAQLDVGKSVTVRITSDVAEELHVHGYDLKRELTPGTPVELTFTADIPGVFEVELEHAGLKVAELQVG
jgi:hypothetical protein